MSRTATAYSQVADTLRRKILSGKLKSGEMLPPERELCDHFAASRITIRRALQILAEESLVVRRQGSGTFVCATPSRKIPLLNADFTGSLSRHAPDISRRLDHWEWTSADEQTASLLQIRAGLRVLFARRFDLLAGEPVAYDEIHLVEHTADRLDAESLAELDFLQVWQNVQHIRLGHIIQGVEAVSADKVIARRLQEKVGKPILKELDVVHLATGAPCGIFLSYYKHDLFRITSTVSFTPSSEVASSESAAAGTRSLSSTSN